MIKINRVKPRERGSVQVHPSELSEKDRVFLMANQDKRISVVFTGAFRKRLCKVFVSFMQPTCGCCSDHFLIER